MTASAVHLQKGFHASVRQHRNKGLNACRALELIEFNSVYFLHGVNRDTGFTGQRFNFWFSRGD